MGFQAVELLAHIRLGGQDRGLLRQALLGQRGGGLEQLLDLRPQALPQRLGTRRRGLARGSGQALDLRQTPGDHGLEAPALGAAHGGQRLEREHQVLLHGRLARVHLLLGLLLLDRLDYAANGEQAVEARRRGPDLLLQLAHHLDQLIEQLAVDLEAKRDPAAVDDQGQLQIAAGAVFLRGRARGDLERLVAAGHPTAHVQAAPVDALDLPDPGERPVTAFLARESGHAGDGSRWIGQGQDLGCGGDCSGGCSGGAWSARLIYPRGPERYKAGADDSRAKLLYRP